ncbi:YHS domain-containing (seleno)protein [Reinekea sp.]|jgi:YHS domain-containing protein|uniref:YHS domain-containing (seleno)protein n=1 Tax=Reinekea sp. TaxID=1970455 RepID=UPI002A826F01|nr:YHS domain-containing (seleno)protein [Reinekea sp.]
MRQINRAALVLLTVLVSTMVFALDPIYTPWHNNLAIRGYDPVAYFEVNQAVEGREEFAYDWQGARWLFASAQRRQAFIDNPTAYAPQYGGYCAFAVANNKTASIEPEQFTIVEGKLYLNYNKKIQQQWLQQRSELIQQADANWPALLAED